MGTGMEFMCVRVYGSELYRTVAWTRVHMGPIYVALILRHSGGAQRNQKGGGRKQRRTKGNDVGSLISRGDRGGNGRVECALSVNLGLLRDLSNLCFPPIIPQHWWCMGGVCNLISRGGAANT